MLILILSRNQTKAAGGAFLIKEVPTQEYAIFQGGLTQSRDAPIVGFVGFLLGFILITILTQDKIIVKIVKNHITPTIIDKPSGLFIL